MKQALKFVFPKTLPILAGFLFLGISFGIFARSMGLPVFLPPLLSIFIYAGSMEFVTVSLILAPYNPLAAFILTLMLNGRHLFYGLSMLGPYRDLGWKKYYIIFGMCDESFSINSSMHVPQDIDKGWAYFHVTWLNQLYWVSGTTIGAVFGDQLPLPDQGIEFVLNALFIVLLLEIWMNRKQHLAVAIGLSGSLVALWFFGQSQFIIPAMVFILLAFASKYKYDLKGVEKLNEF